jgi:hypothetical protein
LDIRYTKNRHQIPIKQQQLTPSMKKMVINLYTNKQIDHKLYQELSAIEQHLLRSLLPYFGLDKDDVDDIDSFHDRFEVIKGQILAGNDNKALKRECKAYLLHALNIGFINRSTFNNILQELDL